VQPGDKRIVAGAARRAGRRRISALDGDARKPQAAGYSRTTHA